jgi:uncharacterized oligopeptide transporter (OPT) family protein
VAGELLQDFKAGYILGGTPRTIQIVELIAVVCASLVMYFLCSFCTRATSTPAVRGLAIPSCRRRKRLMALLAQGTSAGTCRGRSWLSAS